MAGTDHPAVGVAHLVFGDVADRVCHDIPDSACDEQPRNLTLHLVSLTATKAGDGFLDPKLVLPWIVGALGGSATAVGLLVPVRESLALLAQLFVGHRIRRMPVRKWVWTWAAVTQGLAVSSIAVVGLFLDGATAGWTILGLLAVFALARSFASVSYKDVLGKTVSKTRRGAVTGTAASVSAVVVLGFGGGLAAGVIPLTVTAVSLAVLAGGILWLVAAAAFSRLVEAPGATGGGVDATATAFENITLLWKDPQLGRFVVTRSLLTVTAIAPPYLLQLGAGGGRRLGDLGPFVVASSVATIVGGRLWGELSDRSSRKVLMGAGLAASGLFVTAGAGALAGADLLAEEWVASALLFLVVLAYQGVRLGRSTHLVDMASADDRAVYTAVSNTVVGGVILATGVFGPISEAVGPGGVLVAFAALSLVAVAAASGLEEVQAPR